MLLFYFLFWTAVTATKEPLYGKIGDEVVLTPDSAVNVITSIEWKHGPHIAMDCYGGKTTAYRHFKDRGSLNTLTGALTITGLTPDDSGNYTVEINNKLTSKTELLVISPVSKPTLSMRCEKTYCVLTCNGNTTDAELVTYRWTSSDDTWSSTKEHNITMEDSELWFSCAFENPVSFKSSEIVFNPFMEKEPLYVETGQEVVLTSDSSENLITSIVWKLGPHIAMDWYGDETSAYRQFRDRGLLDTSNGALTITGLTPDDNGNYTVEINGKLTSKTELQVISPVSKPTVSEWCAMTYCVLTCNGNTTGAEPVTYWWKSGDTTWSSTKEHKITMVEKELWLSWFSCAFENPVNNISSEDVFNPFIRNQLIFMAILFLVVCIIIITFRHKGIIDLTRDWIKEFLKWTFIYILVCILIVFNIILMFDSNFEGSKELLTRMIIVIAVIAVILVGFIILFIYFIYKFGKYYAGDMKWMLIFLAVLFLDMFNIIMNLIYEGINVDMTMMIIVIAVIAVILVGFIIFFIYFVYKVGKGYLIWDVMYMMPCISGLFNIIILMYKAINGGVIWMIILTAIFGVILVGGIIIYFYLTYKWIKHELRWMIILIAVCTPVVFNIINSIYTAVIGGLTWMIIVSAIFGVILVGGIIFFIVYFRYKARSLTYTWDKDNLRMTFMLTAIGISGVCNIIINLIYKGRTDDLTWMFNFIPVCMLVGFIIIIIYLTYKGIIYFRPKWREWAAERKWQEFQEKLEKGEADENLCQEILKCLRKEIIEWLRYENVAERAGQEYLERWRNGEAAESGWQEYLEKRRNGEAERKRQEYLERVQIVNSTISEINNKSTQDPTSVVSQDTSNVTERPASIVAVQETSNQDTTSIVPPETSNETEMLEMVPLKKTSTQDQEIAESSDPSNETEKSAMNPDELETCRLLVEEQTAEPQDEAQS